MKKIIILGSTGSIGEQTLSVIRENKENFEVVALACQSNISKLNEQISEFQPKKVCSFFPTNHICHQQVVFGLEGLVELAMMDADIIMICISSSIAILPTIKAIESGKTIALATKEVLVAAGELITNLANRYQTKIIPVDSEHSAIYQCLKGEKNQSVSRLILTASGGPFWKFNHQQLKNVTLEQALNHPNWTMGKKITVDSSTLMNKALEVIEAHWLFNIPIDKISVTVHPQSVIHSMVEFIDGSMIAQASKPSMIIPIHVALYDPERTYRPHTPFPFDEKHCLEFFPVDHDRFPCLKLGTETIKVGQSLPCFMNKVNEHAVDLFLKKQISWNDIYQILSELIPKHQPIQLNSYEAVIEVEEQARQSVEDLVLLGRF